MINPALPLPPENLRFSETDNEALSLVVALKNAKDLKQLKKLASPLVLQPKLLGRIMDLFVEQGLLTKNGKKYGTSDSFDRRFGEALIDFYKQSRSLKFHSSPVVDTQIKPSKLEAHIQTRNQTIKALSEAKNPIPITPPQRPKTHKNPNPKPHRPRISETQLPDGTVLTNPREFKNYIQERRSLVANQTQQKVIDIKQKEYQAYFDEMAQDAQSSSEQQKSPSQHKIHTLNTKTSPLVWRRDRRKGKKT